MILQMVELRLVHETDNIRDGSVTVNAAVSITDHAVDFQLAIRRIFVKTLVHAKAIDATHA